MPNNNKVRLAGEEEEFLLFYNARSFHVSATKLGDLPQTDFFLWPTIMCEAFGLELHVKCLLMLRGRTNRDIHGIQSLFDLLSDDDKNRIRDTLQELVLANPLYVEAQSKRALRLDLETVLKRANKMFVRSRYWHEGVEEEALLNDEMCTAGIGTLSDAITKLILEIRPDWTEEKMKDFNIARLSYSQPPT